MAKILHKMYKQSNRRVFLKQAAAAAVGAAGFPYLICPSALGKNGTTPPGSRIVLAIIGAGSMGRANLNSFLALEQAVQVVAVCDVDDRHAQDAKAEIDKKYGNRDCRVYRDYRQLLEKESLDAVSIAVPDHWHAAIAIACADKGLDIYGEKPLARTIGEGRLICQAVERSSVVWQTGSWQRSVRNFHQACELVINGRIGKVDYVEVGLPNGPQGRPFKPLNVPEGFDWEMWLGPAPWRPYQDFGRGNCHWDWRWIMDYSGGQLTDWAGHHIDIAHWGLGLDYEGPVAIEGKGDYPSDGIYDAPYAYDFMCTYANGLKIRVANAGKQPHGGGVRWYGDKGWIHVDRGRLEASSPAILQEKIGADEIRLYKSENHHLNFIECIKSRRQTITPAQIAHRSISVGLLGEIAMLTGRKLRWNPKTEQFINDAGADSMLMRAFRSPWRI